jgi:hypothetical protein
LIGGSLASGKTIAKVAGGRGSRSQSIGGRIDMGFSKRRRSKYRNFVMVCRDMLNHPEWRGLSPSAKLAYLYVKDGYIGTNNGNIQVPYTSLRDVVGLRSTSTISTAFRDLEKNGWIRRKKERGLFRTPSLFELTGKYDDCI